MPLVFALLALAAFALALTASASEIRRDGAKPPPRECCAYKGTRDHPTACLPCRPTRQVSRP